MNLYGRVKYLAEKKEIAISRLEQELGFGNGTIRKWDKTIPSGDRLQKVADFFHVSVDYLLGRDEETDEEIIILSRAAKNMTPEKRKKLLEMAKVMFEEDFK